MRNKKKMLVILLLLVVGISIGYAAITTTLNINGNTKIEKASWDVHFENLVLSEGIVDASVPAAIDSTKTVINYTINLAEPGDFYEFTVDIVNSGSIDAMISEVLKEGLSADQEKYIDYDVRYSDGYDVLENDALNAGSSRSLVVTVKYKENINSEDLPTEEEILNLSFSITYIQDDGTSISVCDYEVGKEWTFSYKGSPEEFKVPCKGIYELEVYGASGGNGKDGVGGAGGYSTGNIKLSNDTSLFVVVGGSGKTATQFGGILDGGYNGGGAAFANNAVGSGGGATHIATSSGELVDLSSNKSDVLIVAGGGGGAGVWVSTGVNLNGGAGGGLSGEDAFANCYSDSNLNNKITRGGGGTQTSGGQPLGYSGYYSQAGIFGQGGNPSNYGGAGGGGGYYGGASGGFYNGGTSAGGGSGYIGGVVDGNTIAGNLEIPTYDGTGTMTGNTGDGYAKITLISID